MPKLNQTLNNDDDPNLDSLIKYAIFTYSTFHLIKPFGKQIICCVLFCCGKQNGTPPSTCIL